MYKLYIYVDGTDLVSSSRVVHRIRQSFEWLAVRGQIF